MIITDSVLHHVRQIIAKVLDLPREDVALVLILSENTPTGSTQRMSSFGLCDDDLRDLLMGAARTASESKPIAVVPIESIKASVD